MLIHLPNSKLISSEKNFVSKLSIKSNDDIFLNLKTDVPVSYVSSDHITRVKSNF